MRIQKDFLVSVLILTLLGVGCVSQPTSNSNSVEPVTGEVSSIVCEPTIKVLLDVTGSQSDESFAILTDELMTALQQCDGVKELIIVAVGRNGGGAFTAPIKRMTFPVKDIPKFDEAKFNAEAQKECGLLQNCVKREMKEYRRAYQADVVRLTADYEGRRKAILDEARAFISQKSEKTAPCSNIGEMAEHAIQSTSSRVIWISDGFHDCATTIKAQDFSNKKVFFGLIALKNEPSNSFGTRLAKLTELYPKLEIVPVTAVGKDTLIEFLKAR